MMKITADLTKGTLQAGGAVFAASSNVRTFRGGGRSAADVARTIPGNLPYDPRPFPKGRWKITGVEWQRDAGFDAKTYGPVKIKTDAWQPVNVWELDGEGRYLRETGRQVNDAAYWLHYSEYGTTLGCIRLASPSGAAALADAIQAALNGGEDVWLEVV